MSARSGAALLESIAAVAIIASAGLGATAVVAAHLDAAAGLAEREAELRGAERVLVAVSLLESEELDQRLGNRVVGDFVTWVDRPRPRLYRLGVSPVSNPENELLSTLLYFPPPAPEPMR